MPGVVGSPPMTYLADGKQFLLMWVTDRASGKGAELVALTVK